MNKKSLTLADWVTLPKTKCLNCGTQLDAASGIVEDGTETIIPAPGDVTMCISCGHIMSFDNNLQLQMLTSEQMLDIAGRPDIVALQTARLFSKIQSMTDIELECTYPSIPWREPIKIVRADGIVRFCCRLCIAHKGLKAKDLEAQFTNPEAVLAHIRAEHVR